jgi:hypothetical protein
VLQRFENEQPTAFAEDGSLRVGIERSDRVGGGVVMRFVEPAEQRLADDAHRVDAALGTAADGQVGLAALERAEGFADRQVA